MFPICKFGCLVFEYLFTSQEDINHRARQHTSMNNASYILLPCDLWRAFTSLPVCLSLQHSKVSAVAFTRKENGSYRCYEILQGLCRDVSNGVELSILVFIVY